MKAKVLWIDDRKMPYFEGQVLGDDNKKYYFNYSTSLNRPKRGQIVDVKIDDEYPNCVFVLGEYNSRVKV